MPLSVRATRLASTLVVVCVVVLGGLPVGSASAAAPSASAATGTRLGGELTLYGDTGSAHARSRRGVNAWRGRQILYTESLPAKWDWSLSTALSKWNTAGGAIHFVRAANTRKARLHISYGDLGGAAGMATVGRSRHAWVKLSSTYHGYDSLDARNRVEVMAVLTHELGHVLGFEHTSATCSLMSPVMDVDGCHMVSAAVPGYYQCRTIDTALVARFVRMYGGRANHPATWCAIEPIPSALSRVSVTGGAGSPLSVRWTAPSPVQAGSRVRVGVWQASSCGAMPTWAEVSYASATAGRWGDDEVRPSGTTCVSVQMVNRYDAGRSAVSRSFAY